MSSHSSVSSLDAPSFASDGECDVQTARDPGDARGEVVLRDGFSDPVVEPGLPELGSVPLDGGDQDQGDGRRARDVAQRPGETEALLRRGEVDEHDVDRCLRAGSEGPHRVVRGGHRNDRGVTGLELLLNQTEVSGVGGHHERADAGEVAVGRAERTPVLRRDREPEIRADARLADDADVTAHQVDEVLGDGETEPGALELMRRRRVGLREPFEDVFVQVPGNAHTGVDHLEIGSGSRSLPGVDEGRAHDDGPFLRELERVAEDVGQDLA